jgi:hypothetical protein
LYGFIIVAYHKKQTRISRFITNQLFGKGRQWNGKSFASCTGNPPSGVNRFERYTNRRTNKRQWTVTLATETDHGFDYEVVSSSSLSAAGGGSAAAAAVVIRYGRHQPFFSLWRSMRDELRVLPGSDGTILIGLGSMAWSGGPLNAAPFCLYRPKR